MNKQIKKIIRVALLILALVNVVLAMFGLSPIDLDSETVTNFINSGAVIAMALWNTWKNCSVTQPHLKADEIAKHIKQGAEIVIKYQAGGEFAETGTEAEHEIDDPEDAEVIE
jgi:SPP1 family holin